MPIRAWTTKLLSKRNRMGIQYLIEYARNSQVAFVLLINTGNNNGGIDIWQSYLAYVSKCQQVGISYVDLDQLARQFRMTKKDMQEAKRVLSLYLEELQKVDPNALIPMTEISSGQYIHGQAYAHEIAPTIERLIEEIQIDLGVSQNNA